MYHSTFTCFKMLDISCSRWLFHSEDTYHNKYRAILSSRITMMINVSTWFMGSSPDLRFHPMNWKVRTEPFGSYNRSFSSFPAPLYAWTGSRKRKTKRKKTQTKSVVLKNYEAHRKSREHFRAPRTSGQDFFRNEWKVDSKKLVHHLRITGYESVATPSRPSPRRCGFRRRKGWQGRRGSYAETEWSRLPDHVIKHEN